MVPGAYDAYFGAAATASAALIGLLFVAVSVRDDTIFGPHAVPGGEALAITAFIGLVNSFVVSLLGLIPKTNIGEPAVIMGVISIVSTVRLYRRLHAGRNLIVLAIALLAYAAQIGYGVLLIRHPHDSDQVINLSFLIFATLIVSLQVMRDGADASCGGGFYQRLQWHDDNVDCRDLSWSPFAFGSMIATANAWQARNSRVRWASKPEVMRF